MTGQAAIALGVGSLVGRRGRVDPLVTVPFGLMAILAPIPTSAAALLGWSIRRFRRAASASRATKAAEVAALEAGDLVGLGLAGGLSTAAACRLARDHCAPEIAPALDRLVSAIERHGVVRALRADDGPLEGVSTALVTATVSGAPVRPALDAHLRQQHHRRHMETVEAARRLPIRLLLPLTLLVLPGFVLITVGPTVIESLARLSP